MRDHDGVVDKYNSTTDRFNKMLTQVQEERDRLNKDINTTNTDYLKAMNEFDSLSSKVNHSGLEVQHLQKEFEIYSNEMKVLEGKYTAFLKDLRDIVGEQEVELKTVTESFRNKESQISQL